MPEKGWRKRLQEKRPKPASQPKGGSLSAATDSSSSTALLDRVLPSNPDKPSWRKTYHGSRPETPLATSATPTLLDDAEDSRSEAGSDATTGRGRSNTKPKLSRYLSDYLSLTTPKSPDFPFSEPWNEDQPYEIEPPVDPLVAVQQIRSHIGEKSREPIPLEFNSAILCVFEDYRKVREEKERLDALMQQSLDGYKADLEVWEEREGRYKDEIRRLELFIAHGTSGMAGLMKARQGSVLDREHKRRQTLSSVTPQESGHSFPKEKLDDQIRAHALKVIYHRPTSPSAQMAALSKRFSTMDIPDELPIGTPPDRDRPITLSRKIKSEMDLLGLSKLLESPSDTLPGSVSPDGTHSDPQPTLDGNPPDTAGDMGVECEAFVALRELATLVAVRRGINKEEFIANLMRLYSATEVNAEADEIGDGLQLKDHDAGQYASAQADATGTLLATEHNVRRFPSQPHLTLQRHFSFEPGDDELGTLNEKLKEQQVTRPKSPAGSQSTKSSDEDVGWERIPSDISWSRSQTLGVDPEKPTKIPTPVDRSIMSRPRRENSISSLRTVSSHLPSDDRRESKVSRSSVRTAIRSISSGSLPVQRSTSESNPLHDQRQTHVQLQSPNTDFNRSGISAAALAAARTVGASTIRPVADFSSDKKGSPRGQYRQDPTKSLFTENDKPNYA
ncbi:hypothetical protein M011DRAFT_461511 [Sporormia fimetaria CBS 119925]|uniref:Uncharacterized protein n=1 Tax=Sporormia fimetaria CBS 119925 TaxID=1340428 RepID=A0A6A6UZH4_9PLEO|nr:hypothetical protein M011DRAFT_461511 [Sporormia fimetaria CBS 119925]